LGPVDLPPCREQRPLRLYAGLWQGVPLRVLAPHRWPGQSGPKRHLLPVWNLTFITVNNLAALEFIIPHLWWWREGWVAWYESCEPVAIISVLGDWNDAVEPAGESIPHLQQVWSSPSIVTAHK